jgi:hypothetical protein
VPEPALIRVEAGSRFPVSVPEGFDYITNPRNWLDYWPRAISVEPGARWERPDDHARVVLRLGGLRVALDMTLVRIDPYRLVEYTSQQTGLPAARHWRRFEERDGKLAYRIVVEYAVRSGWRTVVDRSVVRAATERAVSETLANLHTRFRRDHPPGPAVTGRTAGARAPH